MIRWPVEHLRAAAVQRAAAVPELDRSMRGLEARQIGALGELVALEYLEACGVGGVSDVSDTRHDILTPFGTIDVKTKERTVAPRPEYDCTAPDYNHDHQIPDWYLFVSCTADRQLKAAGAGIDRILEAWVLGTIRRERFDRVKVRWATDQTDASNGWQPTIVCWNVPISSLRPPRKVTRTV